MKDIAIVGMSCRFPGAASIEKYWDLLRHGRCAIDDVPSDRWNARDFYDPDPTKVGKIYIRQAGFIADPYHFDPAAFGLSEREALAMDPQQRILLELSTEAFADAGLTRSSLRGTRTGVFMGGMWNDYFYLSSHGVRNIDAFLGLGNSQAFNANRLSFHFDLKGPSFAIDSACASSLIAVHEAYRSLITGESELAIAGGVILNLHPRRLICACKVGFVSRSGQCRVFDQDADGTMLGEGAGCIVMKPLEAARRDGDRIYSIICGSTLNQDGHSEWITSPDANAQVELYRRAYEEAGIVPESVGYLELHGTGTPKGDPIEAQGIQRFFKDRQNPLWVGSVKPNIGHLEAASGIASIIKLSLAMLHGEIPRSIHHEKPIGELSNPAIRFLTQNLPIKELGRSWVAGVTSLSLGGTNGHIVLKAPPVETKPAKSGRGILTLSGSTSVKLEAEAQSYMSFLASSPSETWPEICAAKAVRRDHHRYRLAVAADSAADAIRKIPEALAQTSAAKPDSVKIAFVFPGHGSSYSRMARELFRAEPEFRRIIEECDQQVQSLMGYSLVRELLETQFGQDRSVRETVLQPLSFAIRAGLSELMKAWGIRPDFVIGHSQGEITAAYSAGILSLQDAVTTICRRSQLVEQLSSLGTGMMVVELSTEEVVRLIADKEISIAAYNSPDQAVLSGPVAELDELRAQLESRNIFAQKLKVNYGSHCPIVDRIKDDLLTALQSIPHRDGEATFCSTAREGFLQGSSFSPDYWFENLRNPVRFQAGIERLLKQGANLFVELSAHPTLTTAVSRTIAEARAQADVRFALSKNARDSESVSRLLAELYSSGLDLKWGAIEGAPTRNTSLPAPAWEKKSLRIDPEASLDEGSPLFSIFGQEIKVAGADLWIWQGKVSTSRFPFLRDHQVQGQVVVPGTVYVEMAYACLRRITGSSGIALKEITFQRPVMLLGDDSHELQLKLEASAHGDYTFEIHDRTRAEQPWRKICAGRGEKFSDASLSSIFQDKPQLPKPDSAVAAPEFYAELRENGNFYGNSFQKLVRVDFSGNTVVAAIEPGAAGGESDPFVIHPALLDSCLHFVAVSPGRTTGFMPKRVGQIIFHDAPFVPAFCVAEKSPASGESRLHVCIYDSNGRKLVEVLDIELHLFEEGEVFGKTFDESWLYETAWLPLARPKESVIPAPELRISEAEVDFATLIPNLSAEIRRKGIRTLLYFPNASGKISQLAHTIQNLSQILVVLESAPEPKAKLWVITNGTQSVPGHKASGPLGPAGLWGFAQSAAAEAPGSWGGIVDIGAEDSLTLDTLRTVIQGSPLENQLAIRGQEVFARRLQHLSVPAAKEASQSFAIRSDRSYLVTGGLGGVGFVVSNWLLAKGAGELVICGRTPLPDSSIWESLPAESPYAEKLRTLARARRSGKTIRYLSVDISDADATRTALGCLSGASQHPLAGVFHCAGIESLQSLEEMTAEKADQVIRPKAIGALNLANSIPSAGLDFIVYFSSLSSIIGSHRMGHYAAANAILDSLAKRSPPAAVRAISINWGQWAGLGMNERQGSAVSFNQAFGAFSAEEGIHALEHILASPREQTLVAPINWWLYQKRYLKGANVPFLSALLEAPQPDMASGETAPHALLDFLAYSLAPPEVRRNMVREHLLQCLARTLRARPEALNWAQPLIEVGLDSIFAVELKNRIESIFGVKTTLVQLLGGSSADQLATTIGDLLDQRASAASKPEVTSPDKTKQILDNLDHLSEEEVQALLKKYQKAA